MRIMSYLSTPCKALIACLAIVMMSIGFTACTDTIDNPVTEDEEISSGSVGGYEFTPTKLFDGTAYVAPTVDENIRQAFKWAVGHVGTELPELLEYGYSIRYPVYVINKLTDINPEELRYIYDHGETVILTQPVAGEIKAYQAEHGWLTIDSDLSETVWLFGFSNNSKAIINKMEPTGDPVLDNTDLDQKAYISLASYITKFQTMYWWAYSAAGGENEEEKKKIENLFDSYHFIHTNSYNANVHYDTTWGEKYYLTGTGAATTLLDVYPIHVYEGQAGAGDYFAVKMNSSVANASMWKGKGWNRRIGIYIRYCGFWCTNFDTKVEPLLNETTAMPVNQLQFLASCPPTPETTRNKKEYEDSKSFSLDVTATGKAESGEEVSGDKATSKSSKGLQVQVALGWEWAHKEKYSIENVEIEDRHSGNKLDWNIKFNDLPYFKWSEDYGFKITESLPYRNTQGLNASWMWYDPTVKDETEVKPLMIKITTNPQYEMQHFWTTKADLNSKTYNHSKTEYFKIPRPNNKRAGEIVIKNDLPDEMTIYDVKVMEKGKMQVLGGFEQTIPNGGEESLGWYFSTDKQYVVTFMAGNTEGEPPLYTYSLNDGFKVKHMGKVTLYCKSDFKKQE